MDEAFETRTRQKQLLYVLLKIKKDDTILAEFIEQAVATMVQEDVAWVEKVVGVTALEHEFKEL